MEKILNIYFYNFFLLARFLGKLIPIYLNPFTWFNNFNKIKLGSKLFFEHLEKNYPTFLHEYKYIFKVKIHFILFLALVNFFFVGLCFFIMNISIPKYYVLILLVSLFLSIIESYVYIFDKDKYQSYFKEFYETKKYNYPFITFLLITSLIFIWFYVIFFNALN